MDSSTKETFGRLKPCVSIFLNSHKTNIENIEIDLKILKKQKSDNKPDCMISIPYSLA